MPHCETTGKGMGVAVAVGAMVAVGLGVWVAVMVERGVWVAVVVGGAAVGGILLATPVIVSPARLSEVSDPCGV
jgi:hypothetical protein